MFKSQSRSRSKYKKTAENCRIVLKTIQPCHSYHSCLLFDFPFIWMLIKGNNAKICLFFASYSMSDTFLKSSTLGRGFKGQIQHRKGLNLVTTLSSQEGCSWQDYFAFDRLSNQRQSASVMFSMPFRANLLSFQPDFAQEMDTELTRLYSFLST